MRSYPRFFNRLLRLLDFLVAYRFGINKKSGVALIRLDAIGDFIIWSDSAKEFRKFYPSQKITLITNAICAELARELPYWDEVMPVKLEHLSSRKLIHRLFFLFRIRSSNFQVAIQPTFSRNLMHGDSVIRATHANYRIGSVGDGDSCTLEDRLIGNSWYTLLVPATSKPLMELMRNAEFIHHLTGVKHSINLPKLPIKAGKQMGFQSPFFMVFPGASMVGRRWTKESFVEVIHEMNDVYGWSTVLCGNSSEFKVCEEIAAKVSTPCINMAGKTTLLELVELIRQAKILVSNETSAAHIGLAVGTITLCLLGGGHFGRFFPYPEYLSGNKQIIAFNEMSCFNCNWQCTQPYVMGDPLPCIAAISVHSVIDKIHRAIELKEGIVKS
jgi:ADP-heptose:LPS heptosyltransferase